MSLRVGDRPRTVVLVRAAEVRAGKALACMIKCRIRIDYMISLQTTFSNEKPCLTK